MGRYLQSVHYFDRAFGAFIDRLGPAGLLRSVARGRVWRPSCVLGGHAGDPATSRFLPGRPLSNVGARTKAATADSAAGG